MSKTNIMEEKVLDHIFDLAAYSPPTSYYIGLFTAAPGETGGGTEVSGGSYARQAVLTDATGWSRTGSTISNVAAITFPVATANWGTVTHFGVFSAITAGDLYFYGALTTSKTIETDDQAKFNAGALTFTED